MVTFGPDGAYGHPDHIAISQFTRRRIVAAADRCRVRTARTATGRTPSSKLYYMAWPQSTWAAYRRRSEAVVDGRRRRAPGDAWPDWAITTGIDTRELLATVWRAVACHESQVAGYERLSELSPELTRRCGAGSRSIASFSTVNGGRTRETDLFEGIR